MNRMPTAKNIGEPCAGEPHARFEVAAGGNAPPNAWSTPAIHEIVLASGRRATWQRASRRPYSKLLNVTSRRAQSCEPRLRVLGGSGCASARSAESDARAVIVVQTRRGRALLENALDIVEDLEAAYAEHLGHARLTDLKGIPVVPTRPHRRARHTRTRLRAHAREPRSSSAADTDELEAAEVFRKSR